MPKSNDSDIPRLPDEELEKYRRECEGCSNICDVGVKICPKCRTLLSWRSLPVAEAAPPKPEPIPEPAKPPRVPVWKR